MKSGLPVSAGSPLVADKIRCLAGGLRLGLSRSWSRSLQTWDFAGAGRAGVKEILVLYMDFIFLGLFFDHI